MKFEEYLARRFHEIYEELAPQYNYETRKESAVSWDNVPENNKNLMIAVCNEICHEFKIENEFNLE
jgi:hypothetical protein